MVIKIDNLNDWIKSKEKFIEDIDDRYQIVLNQYDSNNRIEITAEVDYWNLYVNNNYRLRSILNIENFVDFYTEVYEKYKSELELIFDIEELFCDCDEDCIDDVRIEDCGCRRDRTTFLYYVIYEILFAYEKRKLKPIEINGRTYI